MRLAASALAGFVFGLGLVISGMINPAKVIGFLDVAGDWDPSLILVMGGALAVTFVGYRLVWRRSAPLFEPAFQTPPAAAIDTPLLSGAALFGIGWGLSGLCPGPAVSAAALGNPDTYAFLAAMAAGMGARKLIKV